MARAANQLRPVKIERFPSRGPAPVPGSVMIWMGRTQVLCAASISTELPPHLKPKPGEEPTQGWVTAEYGMLPGSTPERKKRGPDSRATEIQRLIGRVLRAAVDLKKIPGLCITCDCDVLVADGGTRTASITGGFVALAQAVAWARKQGLITQNPIRGPVAAVSVGIVDGKMCLDLDYEMDVRAQVDMNVAMDHRGRFVEIQGTAEAKPFTQDELAKLLRLARRGIRQLMQVQRQAMKRLGI